MCESIYHGKECVSDLKDTLASEMTAEAAAAKAPKTAALSVSSVLSSKQSVSPSKRPSAI